MIVALTAGETFCATIDAEAVSVVAYFRGASSHDVTATPTGRSWRLDADTTAWAPGEYRWQAWVTTSTGSKRVVADYPLTLRPSLVGETAMITKTKAVEIVEKLEAMIAGGIIAEGVKSYQINNRQLENYGVGELLDLLKYWRGRMIEERRRARGQSPLGPRIAVHC